MDGFRRKLWCFSMIISMFANLHSIQAVDNLITEISSVSSDCDHGPITNNVALKHELRAGKFWRLGIVDSMQQCIEMCCKKEDCEMAYMPGNHCYGVDCFSEKHCEVTGIKPNVNLTVKIATVRPIVENTGASRMFNVEDPSTKEELHCTQSPVLANVTLRGGVKAGKFSDLGDVEGMHMCIALCCESRSCDLAFMIGTTCIAVDCYSEEMCQAVRARPTSYNPRISYMRKREFQRMGRKADTLPTKPRGSSEASPRQEIISARLPHRTILKTSTCSAVKIHHNVTLLGGIKAGNLTALGKTKNMQECIGKSCDLERGDLAFMLGNDCYSITCYSDRVCETIPAKPSRFTPRLTFLKWSPKENETEALLEEHTKRKKIPHCTRSHILYNHTVVGGLRAGNFTKIAEVDSIETCAALCCAENTCDLALMLGENCYAGDCASKELCKPIAAQQSSQIAYITSRRAHDNSLDWSMWYLVVGTIAIVLGVLGITWTVCTCYTRNRSRLKSRQDDHCRFGMMDEYGDSIRSMHMLPQEKYMTSGPLFLSDTETDTEDEPEPQPIQKKSLPRQSLKNVVLPLYRSPPPSYKNQANVDLSRARRSMQNL